MRACKGIYGCHFQADRGRLDSFGLTAESLNPSFLAVHPNQRFVYAVNEIAEYEGRAIGVVSAFRIEPASGMLTLLNIMVSGGSDPYVPTQGKTPRNFAVDPAGSYLLAGNQNSDNADVFRIDTKTGPLTPTGQVLEVPLPACVMFRAVS